MWLCGTLGCEKSHADIERCVYRSYLGRVDIKICILEQVYFFCTYFFDMKLRSLLLRFSRVSLEDKKNVFIIIETQPIATRDFLAIQAGFSLRNARAVRKGK